MKAVVAAFNQEKALVGAFSVIVQFYRLIVFTTTAELQRGVHLHVRLSPDPANTHN